jgi:hypothetical protein
MCKVQMLAELEEVVEYKLAPERRSTIRDMWWKRLQVYYYSPVPQVSASDPSPVFLYTQSYESCFMFFLKVVTSEKIGWSGVASTLGTWYGVVVMGFLLSFDEAAI